MAAKKTTSKGDIAKLVKSYVFFVAAIDKARVTAWKFQKSVRGETAAKRRKQYIKRAGQLEKNITAALAD